MIHARHENGEPLKPEPEHVEPRWHLSGARLPVGQRASLSSTVRKAFQYPGNCPTSFASKADHRRNQTKNRYAGSLHLNGWFVPTDATHFIPHSCIPAPSPPHPRQIAIKPYPNCYISLIIRFPHGLRIKAETWNADNGVKSSRDPTLKAQLSCCQALPDRRFFCDTNILNHSHFYHRGVREWTSPENKKI